MIPGGAAMRVQNRSRLLTLVLLLAAAPGVSRAIAESGAPATGLGTNASPTIAANTELPKGTGCNTIQKPSSAGGASVVQATGESLQHKNWQANGGDIQLTIKSFVPIPPDASVYVCFRWKVNTESKQTEIRKYIETRPSRLDMDADGKVLKVTTTIPDDLGAQPEDIASALPLVPLADVRILAIDNKKKEAVADVSTAVGITHPVAAAVFAIAALILGLVVLYVATAWRIEHPGIKQANWFLRIIATPSGFASLSQLQIILWTFVVAASAVYVMSLSGQLVQITNGTLVLLGIAGAAGLAAKTHSEAQSASAEATAAKAEAEKHEANIIAAEKTATPVPADPALAARLAAESTAASAQAADKTRIADATRAKAKALTNPPDKQVPRWSDLIVNESLKDDGTTTREVDVARFQMLMFTFITATFVLMNVITTYVIPEISTGFLTLMGISNGVYVGAKVAAGT
jgi:hypothetical protein